MVGSITIEVLGGDVINRNRRLTIESCNLLIAGSTSRGIFRADTAACLDLDGRRCLILLGLRWVCRARPTTDAAELAARSP
jgi:hypothetical protein